MKYLLDVNALLAWEHPRSVHHADFHAWRGKTDRPKLWTCAHTELGFLRVSMQVFGYSLLQASDALAEIKKQADGFIASAPSPRLSAWALSPSKTPDAYLAQIARENEMRLGAFDLGIKDPVAELIRPTGA